MICQASYDSLEAIPEALREEFHQVNGKWQLKDTAIPGVGPLFNSALAANEQKAVAQVKTRNEKIRSLEEELNQTKDKLSVLDTPGNKVLSKEDAGIWESYTKLGTPKEIETKLSKTNELEQKVTQFETGEALTKIADANGLGEVKLNPEVLTSWATGTDMKGSSFFVKAVEVTDAKGVKSTVETPFVKVEKTENGKITVTEHELLPFAKEKMPDWMYTALTSGKPEENGKGPVKNKPMAQPKPSGVKLPDLGSSKHAPGKDGNEKRPIDIFNEQRAAKPNPFTKQTVVPVPASSQAGVQK